MNILTSLVLYLAAFFVMITLALLHVLPLNYLGGIVVGLFVTGLIYSWLNAWRQTDEMMKKESSQFAEAFKEEEKAENKRAEEENNPKKLESPVIAA
jgi:Flp pilus assembly protein TadB